jgi:hypothetical protein
VTELELFERLKALAAVKPSAPTANTAAEEGLARAQPEFATPVTMRNLFTHPEAHPVVLQFALVKAFGTTWLDWEPATLFTEIRRSFNTDLSEHIRAKVQVVKTVLGVNAPWQRWEVFEKVIQGLNGNIPRWDIMQKPSFAELYAGVDILEVLHHEDFGPEPQLYMTGIVLDEGLSYVPPPLDFLQVRVSQPYIRCKDCGNERSTMPGEDSYCDVCSGRFSSEQGLSMKPNPELVAQGAGHNTTKHLRYDPRPTEARWSLFLSREREGNESDPVQGEGYDLSTPEEVEVFKLKYARDYANIRRRQMAEQLTMLKGWLGASHG